MTAVNLVLMKATVMVKRFTLRFVILESAMGIGTAIAGIASGYWIDAQGYFMPASSAVIMPAIALCMIPFLHNPSVVLYAKKENNKRKATIDGNYESLQNQSETNVSQNGDDDECILG